MASLFEKFKELDKKSNDLRKLAAKHEDRLSPKVVNKVATRSQVIMMEADNIRRLLRGPSKKKEDRQKVKEKIENQENRKKVIEEKQAAKAEKKENAKTKLKSLSLRGKSGGAGGRMMMPQEYSKRSLYKPKTN